jgi:hypothetical protein
MKLKKYQKKLIWRLNPKEAEKIIYFIENYVVIYGK